MSALQWQAPPESNRGTFNDYPFTSEGSVSHDNVQWSG